MPTLFRPRAGLTKARSITGIMNICKFFKSGSAAVALFLLCFPINRAHAQADPAAPDATDYTTTTTATTTDDSKTTIADVEGPEASGLGKYSRWPFHVSVSVRGGYDDNVNTVHTNRQGSAFTNASTVLSYDFGNARTQIDLRTGAGLTYYFDRPGDRDYDVNAFLAVTANHKASPRLSFAASIYATYQAEPDFAVGAGIDRRSGNYFYTSDRITGTYLWAPRFSTATSYTFGRTSYEDDSIGLYEDRFENTFGNEFRFLLAPTTTLVGEYRFGLVTYDDFPRDSSSQFVLAGVDHSFSPRFNISLRGGVEFRDYDNYGEQVDPYFEGTLIYAFGPRVSISWTNRYGLEEPDVPGSQRRTTFRSALSLRYNITQRILANLSLYYTHDDNSGENVIGYASSAFSEDTFVLSLAVRYAINRNWAVEAGYDFSDIESDFDFRSYYRNRIYAGLNLSF